MLRTSCHHVSRVTYTYVMSPRESCYVRHVTTWVVLRTLTSYHHVSHVAYTYVMSLRELCYVHHVTSWVVLATYTNVMSPRESCCVHLRHVTTWVMLRTSCHLVSRVSYIHLRHVTTWVVLRTLTTNYLTKLGWFGWLQIPTCIHLGTCVFLF